MREYKSQMNKSETQHQSKARCWTSPASKRSFWCGVRNPKSLEKRGFTLTEILLVAVILSIIGLSVYGAFNNGIKVWKRIVKNITQEDVSIFFDKISRDLRNTFQYSGVKFEGTAESITFPALVVSDEQVDGIGCVSYFVDSHKNTVNRTQMDYSQIYRDITPTARKLVNNIEKLTFQYYYDDSDAGQFYWKSSWEEEEEKKLPLAVRIQIEFYEDGRKNDVIQTVFIPVCKIPETFEERYAP